MLKGIDKLLTGDLLKVLCDMGHGDELVIADANFPAETCAKRLIRLPQNCDIDATAFDGCDALVAIFGPDGGTAAVWARAREIPFAAE